MDLNYLLRREQECLARSKSSPSRAARAVHSAFAVAYGKLLGASSYPHRSPGNAEKSRIKGLRQRVAIAEAVWENEGGHLRSDLAEDVRDR
ncbi:MAG: hypothetical protein V4618_10740 [Pseudomonadota bacterium]